MSIQLLGVSGSLCAAAGPVPGGLLTYLSWRWIFVINLPIGLAALVAAALFAPQVRHRVETRLPDVLGVLMVIVGIGALVLALVEAPSWGWGSSSTLGTIAVAAAADVEPHQTSTASAVVQMARQIGSVVEVAALILVVGASTVSASSMDSFAHPLWWAGLFAVLAAIAAPGFTRRGSPVEAR